MTIMHIEATGRGAPTLVFVHGYTCDHTDWEPMVAVLKDKYRCLAVDLPGHGQTPAEPDACRLKLYGRAVADALASQDVRDCLLVGHSLGCRVVLEAARTAPDRCRGLVLVDGSDFAPGFAETLKQRIKAGEFRDIISGMFAQMFTDRSDPETARAAIDRALAMPERQAVELIIDLASYDPQHLDSVLAETTHPLLIIQSTYTGPDRKRVSLAKGQSTPYLDKVRRHVPGARIEIVENCGHFPQLDAVAETNGLIEDFARGLCPGGKA